MVTDILHRTTSEIVLWIISHFPPPPVSFTHDAITRGFFFFCCWLRLVFVQVKGKIVVYNQPYVSYAETVVYRTKGASEASKNGAVAALIRSITPFSLNTPHTGQQDYIDGVPKIPVACITVEDAELLDRLYKRGGHAIPVFRKKKKIMEKSCSRSIQRKYSLYLTNICVYRRFLQNIIFLWSKYASNEVLLYYVCCIGTEVKILLNMNPKFFPNATSRNTVAEIKGTVNPEKIVLVSGHMDSWDVGQGAMDDGGGAFISWNSLVVLKNLGLRPKRTVR